MGLRGATIEDVLEFRGIRIHAPERCPLVVDCQYRDEIVHSLNRERDDNLTVKQDSEDPSSSFSLLQGSSRYDEDWYRIVTCVDPWKELSPLAGIVYKLGSLVGSWAGRFLVSARLVIDLVEAEDNHFPHSNQVFPPLRAFSLTHGKILLRFLYTHSLFIGRCTNTTVSSQIFP